MSNKTRVSFDVVYDEYGHVEFLPLRPERELPDGFMEELCGLLHKLKTNRNNIVNHNYKLSRTVSNKYKLDEMLLLKVGNPSESPMVLYYVFPNRKGSMVYDADLGHFIDLESQDIYNALCKEGTIAVANEGYVNLYNEALEGCSIKLL